MAHNSLLSGMVPKNIVHSTSPIRGHRSLALGHNFATFSDVLNFYILESSLYGAFC